MVAELRRAERSSKYCTRMSGAGRSVGFLDAGKKDPGRNATIHFLLIDTNSAMVLSCAIKKVKGYSRSSQFGH